MTKLKKAVTTLPLPVPKHFGSRGETDEQLACEAEGEAQRVLASTTRTTCPTVLHQNLYISYLYIYGGNPSVLFTTGLPQTQFTYNGTEWSYSKPIVNL